MSEEQFKNMDELMQKNQPSTARALAPLILPKKFPYWITAVTASATILIMMSIMQFGRFNSRTDSLLALNDTMSWDATADEWPEGVEEEIETFDL